jgi:hypothetical protein
MISPLPLNGNGRTDGRMDGSGRVNGVRDGRDRERTGGPSMRRNINRLNGNGRTDRRIVRGRH